MAEIFTPATQPLCQSGWRSHSATQPLTEWLLQPLWQWPVPEWLVGVAEWLLHPLWQSGWVAEWLLQPLWQSGWVAAPATLAEWLSGWVAAPATLAWLHSATLAEWLSGWVAPPATPAERLSGWVAAAESSAKEMDNVFKHFNIQARLYDIDSNLIYKHNPANFNCHSYITFNVWLRTATYTIWTTTWNHLKGKRVLMNSTSSGLERTIT